MQQAKLKQICCLIIFLTQIIFSIQTPKCQSNSNMKYEFNQTHQIKGYHSLCSQFAKRTCCSGKNLQALTKKISAKIIGNGLQSYPVSHLCRRRLTLLLCSTCDGDIGQKIVEGVCPNVCKDTYEACKNDYFSIDSLNKIKLCRDDDIICSKLSDIIKSENNSVSLCQMLGIDTNQNDCWNGIPSGLIKGASKRKANYQQKSSRRRSTSLPSLWNIFQKIQKKYIVYIGLIAFLLSFLSYKWLSIKFKDQARKIKNL